VELLMKLRLRARGVTCHGVTFRSTQVNAPNSVLHLGQIYRSSAVAEIADRTAYNVRHRYSTDRIVRWGLIWVFIQQ